jgi:hypothetical protein
LACLRWLACVGLPALACLRWLAERTDALPGVCACVQAVFSDDIRPVERAANSGMILAAHELAQLAHSLVFGWMQCHWFAAVYLFLLWVRHRWVPAPVPRG